MLTEQTNKMLQMASISIPAAAYNEIMDVVKRAEGLNLKDQVIDRLRDRLRTEKNHQQEAIRAALLLKGYRIVFDLGPTLATKIFKMSKRELKAARTKK